MSLSPEKSIDIARILAPVTTPHALAEQFAMAAALGNADAAAVLDRLSMFQQHAAGESARAATAPMLTGVLRVRGASAALVTPRGSITLRFPALRDASQAAERTLRAQLNALRNKPVKLNAALWADASGVHAEVVGLGVKKTTPRR